MNKKLKLLTVATSALFAFSGNAWGVDVKKGSAMVIGQVNALYDADITTAAGEIDTSLDVSSVSGKNFDAVMHAAVGYSIAKGGVDAPAGLVTLTLDGTLTDDATYNAGKLGAIKIKSLVINTKGVGYNMFNLADFALDPRAGSALLKNATAPILDVSAGDKNIGFVTANGSSTIDGRWFTWGAADKKTNLKISMGVDSAFSNNFDFANVNELLVKGGFALSLNNKEVDKLPAAIRFVDGASVLKDFKDATVLPAVYYSPVATVKGGAAGVIESGTSALTINQLGAASYAIAEVKASTVAAKKLTIGVAATDAVTDSEKAQFVNKLTYGVNTDNTIVFAGSSLSGVGADPFKALPTVIDFGAWTKSVFDIQSATPTLNISVTSTSTLLDVPTFKIKNGATFVHDTAGVLAGIDFKDSIISVAAGTVTVPSGSSKHVVSPDATVAGTVDKPKELTYVVAADKDKKAEFATAADAVKFKFTGEYQKMTVNAVDKTNAVTVTFVGDKKGQEFIVADGATLRLKPTFFAKGENTVSVGKGSTLTAAAAQTFSIFNVVNATMYGTFATNVVGGTATDTDFADAYKAIKDAKVTLSLAEGAVLDAFVGDVNNVVLAGNFTMKGGVDLAHASVLLSEKVIDLGAKTLTLNGYNLLDSGVGVTGSGASIVGGEGDAANTLQMRVALGASGAALAKVATGFKSTGDVYVTEFSSDRKGQALTFSGRGLDTDTAANAKQVVVANITKNTTHNYDSVQIGGAGTITFTGDIAGVKDVTITSDATKSVTMKTKTIEADSLKFNSAGTGVTTFEDDVAINADVKAGTAPVIDFKKSGTLNKNFSDINAVVTAKSMIVNTATVTMKNLTVPTMEFKSASTVDAIVSGLKDLTIGNNIVTFVKDIEVETLNFIFGNGVSSGKLVGKAKVTIGKIGTYAVDETAILEAGKTYKIASAGSAMVYTDSTDNKISNAYFSGTVATSDKDALLTINSANKIGDVLSSNIKTASADEKALWSANLNAISAAAKTDDTFLALQNLSINAGLKDGKQEDVVAAQPDTIIFSAQALNIAGNIVDSRLGDFSAPTVVSSGSPADAEGMGIWVEGVYGSGEQKKDVAGTEATSFKNSMYAAVGGMDYKISDNSLFGVSVGYGSGELKFEDTKVEAKVCGIVALAYAAQNFGDAFFSEKVGFARFDAERTFKREVDAKATSNPIQYFAGVNGGYNIKAGDFVNVAPMFKLRFENVLSFDEKESGATKTLVGIKNEDKKSLIGSAGARIAFNLQASEEMSISPDLHGFVNYDLLASGEKNGKFKVTTSSSSVDMQYANAEAFSADAGVGLTVKSLAGFEIGAKVDAQFRTKYLGYMGSLKVKLVF